MALTHITLRDFVIVHELALDLSSGFSVLTGETGAGKSILIDALQLALGARAEASVVREGASRCEVCAEFEPTTRIQAWLEEAGFEASANLLLRRTVDSSGKSRAWVNGSPATATQLRELGEQLLDIHGQHAWQSLTRPDAVRGLLDAYAGTDTRPLKAAWQAWRQAQQTLADALQAQSTLANERERLAWQIGELEKLNPQVDEWQELSSQHSRLANAQALIDGANQSTALLEGGESDSESGALRQLSRTIQTLQSLGQYEAEFNALAEVLASAQAQAEDVAHSLHSYLRKTDLDPQHLAQLDERMGLWLSLARRYKKIPDELPLSLQTWRQELAQLDAAADLDSLQKAEQAAHKACLQAAKAVSNQRQKAAKPLAQAVSSAMQQLGMQGGRFEVQLQTLDAPAQHGLEEVSFLVAGHEGSTPRPVGKVASGGELSRIALAIAVTTSELGEARTLIFDEVDSGVGGAVAETVGRLMKQLGQHRQVLAVTHLPQVAACADHHLLVSKAAAKGQVISQVRGVKGEERVNEIARMLGGEKLSATTLAHAREMLGDTPLKPQGRKAAQS
ncbi:MAG: DNA repair protein RecN [Limnohabitans sp.]|jgi:DNA repair protein RecN (Recombination protein N)|uniref:DNA repair protein RecN n=1 Tax=Limnohabitans sp. TaxID=1907725 RepID=UPI0025F91636|nr:DNA repair protein RecN [Limnohabitans sp.]MCO4087635.1 DNA repair protein RecN [Limnohabitans sp.]